MWILLATITILGALFLLGRHKQEKIQDARILEHTIRVNHRILSAELEELEALAEKSNKHQVTTSTVREADLAEARSLLTAARKSRDTISAYFACRQNSEGDYKKTKPGDLSSLLTMVFAAMDKTCRARHLLGAVRPFEGL